MLLVKILIKIQRLLKIHILVLCIVLHYSIKTSANYGPYYQGPPLPFGPTFKTVPYLPQYSHIYAMPSFTLPKLIKATPPHVAYSHPRKLQFGEMFGPVLASPNEYLVPFEAMDKPVSISMKLQTPKKFKKVRLVRPYSDYFDPYSQQKPQSTSNQIVFEGQFKPINLKPSSSLVPQNNFLNMNHESKQGSSNGFKYYYEEPSGSKMVHFQSFAPSENNKQSHRTPKQMSQFRDHQHQSPNKMDNGPDAYSSGYSYGSNKPTSQNDMKWTINPSFSNHHYRENESKSRETPFSYTNQPAGYSSKNPFESVQSEPVHYTTDNDFKTDQQKPNVFIPMVAPQLGSKNGLNTRNNRPNQSPNSHGYMTETSFNRPSSESVDFGTDIITLDDVTDKYSKNQQKNGNTFTREVGSTLQFTPTHHQSKGQVFDDVIFDNPSQEPKELKKETSQVNPSPLQFGQSQKDHQRPENNHNHGYNYNNFKDNFNSNFLSSVSRAQPITSSNNESPKFGQRKSKQSSSIAMTYASLEKEAEKFVDEPYEEKLSSESNSRVEHVEPKTIIYFDDNQNHRQFNDKNETDDFGTANGYLVTDHSDEKQNDDMMKDNERYYSNREINQPPFNYRRSSNKDVMVSQSMSPIRGFPGDLKRIDDTSSTRDLKKEVIFEEHDWKETYNSKFDNYPESTNQVPSIQTPKIMTPKIMEYYYPIDHFDDQR